MDEEKVSIHDLVIWCTAIDDFDLLSIDLDGPPMLSISPIESVFNKTTSAATVKNLNLEEYERVTKFHFKEDKKRALVSLLLQKALITSEWNFHYTEFEIQRTKENKPYMYSDIIGGVPTNWNYNVSHHGNFVCIASHGQQLIGIDLVDSKTRSTGVKSSAEYCKMFKNQLTAAEMDAISSQSDENSRYTLFFIYWALKESFVKAIGLGLGYNLLQIEFTIHFYEDVNNGHCNALHRDGYAVAEIANISRNDWKFEFCCLDQRHILAIARGPLSEAVNYSGSCSSSYGSSDNGNSEGRDRTIQGQTTALDKVEENGEMTHGGNYLFSLPNRVQRKSVFSLL